MRWEKIPIPAIDNLTIRPMLITGPGAGFSGGSISTEASMMEPDFRKALSMDFSVIYETKDDWKSQRQVFQGSGEIVGFFRLGLGGYLAQNNSRSKEDLHECAHFIKEEKGKWKEVSHLEYTGVRVWSSEGSWLIAAGQAEKGNKSIFKFLSSDGALNWRESDLGGFNPLEKGRNPLLCINSEGLLFRSSRTVLERLDLKQEGTMHTWEKEADVPVNFNPLALVWNNKNACVIAFGLRPDKNFGIVHFENSAPSFQICRGVPENFLLTELTLSGNRMILTGAVELKNGEVTTGFKNLILESTNRGESWVNIDLPIQNSLVGYAFGAENGVWAVAAGSRVQVLKR